MLSTNFKFIEVKVISEIKKIHVHQCCHSFKIRYLSIRPRTVQERYKLKKRVGMDMGYRNGRTSSHGLWFRTFLNALCLWSDVSRGHGHLLDLCPLSEIVSLSIVTETYDGSSSGAHRALSSVHVRWASDA